MKAYVKIFVVAAIFIMVEIFPVFAGEYKTSDLLKMTIESLHADYENNTAFVRGVGKISREGSVGIFLARRAALVDAQRGLLILRREIQEGQPARIDSVSGYVPPIRLLSESVKDGLYFVEVETSLSELMNNQNHVGKITGLHVENTD